MELKIYCINLKHRVDRRLRMEQQFEKHKLNVEFIEPIEFSGINFFERNLKHLSLVETRKMIFERAIENKYETILILEDDITLCQDFNERLQTALLNAPAKWQEIYLCALRFEQSHGKLQEVNSFFNRSYQNYGTQAVLYRGFDIMEYICLASDGRRNADNICAELVQRLFNSYTVKNYMVKVEDDFSDILGGQVNGGLIESSNKYFDDKL